MANLALQLAVAVVGQLLYSAFAPRPPDQEGPRLDDLNIPAVNPGNPIIRHYGTMKLPGQLIWTTGLIETRHEEKVKGGKGGGGKSQKVITYTYAASVAVAFCEGVADIATVWAGEKLLWRNPMVSASEQDLQLAAYEAERIAYWEDQFLYAVPQTRINRIDEDEGPDTVEVYTTGNLLLPNGTIINSNNGCYDTGNVDGGFYSNNLSNGWCGFLAYRTGTVFNEATWIANRVEDEVERWKAENGYFDLEQRWSQIQAFDGSETQLPSSIIEAAEGVGNVEAYRGTTYLVLENLQLADFGNAIPQLRATVVRKLPEQAADSASESEAPSIQAVLRDILNQASLVEDTDYELASDLADLVLDGMALTRLTSPREAIEILQAVYPFDVVEVQGKLLFRDRDRTSQGTLSLDLYRTHEFGNEPPPLMERDRISDLELPREIALSYQDVSRQWSKNTVRAYRQVSESYEVRVEDLPVSSNLARIQKAAETLLARAIAERNSYKLRLPPEVMRYAPGDVIQIAMPNNDQKLVRIGEMNLGANFAVDVTCVDHVGSRAEIEAIFNDDISGPPLGAWWKPPTIAAIVDVPSLTDENLTNGVYVAMGPRTDGDWPGGNLYWDASTGSETVLFGEDIEDDGGTEWTFVASTFEETAIGYLSGPLNSAVNPYMTDRNSTLTVQFRTPNPTENFIQQNYAQMLRGRDNVLLVGEEIIQFARYIDDGSGLVTFFHLQRGMLGTEWAIYDHTFGETVVHLREEALTRWEIDTKFNGESLDYRAVSDGNDVLAASTGTFIFENQEEKAWPPSFWEIRRKANDAVVLSWYPRARYDGKWQNGVGATTKDLNNYRLEVWDGPPYHDDTSVLRTYEIENARTQTISKNHQIADFGSVQPEIWVALYQYSIGGNLGNPRYQKV